MSTMPNAPTKPEPSRWKTIPIFISSTFLDMHAERDQLNNKVFPAIEERLRERHCRLEPIDLRIGVDPGATESEQEREQRILKVCFQEIDRSRPFLLVLLGDRYGWVPEKNRVQAATDEAGFETVTSGRSVTSLEIEYGLLRKDADQRQRSILLLRNPLPYAEMEKKTAAKYSDEFATDPGAAQRKLHLDAMKQKLADNPLLKPHLHHYCLGWDNAESCVTGLEAWSEMVIDALWAQLDAETLAFSREPDPTWQEQERFTLEEFTERLHRGFAGRKEQVKEAVEFALSYAAEGAEQILCVTAESGAGKSAFFSRVYELLSKQKGPILLAEAGGISPRAGRLYWTLRRWTGELAATMGVKADLPDDMQVPQLEERFAEMLAYAAEERRVILMADALNQFERTDRMAALSWLPDPLPANVRLLATAIPGQESEKLDRRKGTRIVPLRPFTGEDVEDVANVVYARYHRDPNSDVIAQLAAIRRLDGRPAASNALWLTLALELLNLLDADDFAEADAYAEGRPEEKLRRLVLSRAATLPPPMEELYGLFLRQVEKAAGTVEARTFAAAIALSRYGWREDDLKVLLAPLAAILFPGEPPATWDALRFATFRRFFRDHLVARGQFQQFDFTHSSLRAAILQLLQSEWKPSPADPIPALHSAIADCLETTLHDSPSRPDEMMNQTLGTRDLSRFARYYVQPTSGSGKLAEFLVEENHASADALLRFVLSSPAAENLPEYEQAVIGNKFISDLHQALEERDGWALQSPVLESSVALFSRLLEHNPQSADFASDLSVSYSKLGDLHRGLGQGEQARAYYEKDLSIAEELHQRNPQSADFARALSASYNNMGDLHHGLGQGEQARAYYEKALSLREELHQRNPQSADFARGLSVSYERLADLHLGLGQGGQARAYYEKALSLAEELHQRNPQSADFAHNLSVSYNKLGDLHRGLGQGEQARAYYEKALSIAEELHQRNPQSADFARGLSVSYERMARMAEKAGDSHALEWWGKMFDLLSEMKERGALLHSDEPALQQVRAKLGQSVRISSWAVRPTPHPSADPARAAQLNLEYQRAKKAWEALPWLKRMRTPKPEPPTGI